MKRRRSAVIAYDVVCDRRRRQARRCVRAWSLDGQYSLFECELTHTEATELFLQLSEILDSDEDKLMLGWLDKKRNCRAVTRCATPGFLAPAFYAG